MKKYTPEGAATLYLEQSDHPLKDTTGLPEGNCADGSRVIKIKDR